MRPKVALLIVGAITSYSNSTPVQWSPAGGGNGHYYEVVPGPGTTFQRITWDQANAAAQSSLFLGVNGYLGTITSSAESQFVSTLLTDPGFGFAWLGGFQLPGSPEPNSNWQWINGETWSFTNWDTEEPNNFYAGDVGGRLAGSPEDALHSRPGGKWNDLPHDAFLPGYLIEYAIPEPSSILLCWQEYLPPNCIVIAQHATVLAALSGYFGMAAIGLHGYRKAKS